MKRKPAFVALCLLGAPLLSSADTFKLKDGSTVEGRVVSDAGDTYVLEVFITKSIKDERKIPKADVVRITREEPDMKAFEGVAKLLPSADMLTTEDYAQNIAAVQKFLKDYPTSAKSKSAKALLETLKSESAQVAAGSIKINGKMISPAEYQANAYDFDARVQEAKIRKLVSENHFLQALRLFSELDRDYRNTLSYGALASLMKQVIQAQVDEAKQSLATLDARVKARELGIQRMSFEGRRDTEAAISNEAAELEALYKAEKDAKIDWPTTSPFHKVSLEDTVKFGEAELVRLSTVKTILGVDGGKAYRELWNAIHNQATAATVTAAIANARTAAVAPRYLTPLENAAKAIK
ncbi:MAG: hypothetical protein RLZZ214_1937 [Verrucomicrobiota bacterium]